MTQTAQQAGRHLMVNTQPSQSNPVDLTSYEETLLHLTNHSVGEGTTRYHSGGSVDLRINSNINHSTLQKT
jgi:hypothetical protein